MGLYADVEREKEIEREQLWEGNEAIFFSQSVEEAFSIFPQERGTVMGR